MIVLTIVTLITMNGISDNYSWTDSEPYETAEECKATGGRWAKFIGDTSNKHLPRGSEVRIKVFCEKALFNT